MEVCMRESMRKLALWNTRTFKPIMTHDELDPIMATKGFVGLPPSSSWKEYAYFASGTKSVVAVSAAKMSEPPPTLPRPRLPYPIIDGLHIYTYRAFIDAVNFYLQMGDFSELLHVRGLPLDRTHEKSRKWCRIKEDGSIYVYRDGTLDQATENFYNSNKQQQQGCNGSDSMVIQNKGKKNTPVGHIVSLKEIITL